MDPSEFMGLLALLTRRPTPDVIIRSLIDGLLHPLRIERASLHILDANRASLRMAGDFGYPSGSLDRFTAIDVTVDLPVTRVLRGTSMLTFTPDELREQFAALVPSAPDADTADLGGQDRLWAFAPLHASAIPLGALALLGTAQPMRNRHNLAAIQGVCHALALWASNPREVRSTTLASSDNSSLSFSERQLEILSCVSAGMNNTQIAAHLNCSKSTIKHELGKAMSALDASDRIEAAARARQYGLLPVTFF